VQNGYLPCIEFATGGDQRLLLPAEFLQVIPGQLPRTEGGRLDPQLSAAMINHSCMPPAEVARVIETQALSGLGVSQENIFLVCVPSSPSLPPVEQRSPGSETMLTGFSAFSPGIAEQLRHQS
jgi:hypothetical protein